MIEFIEVGCIAIAAFIMAFGEAFKREPHLWEHIPSRVRALFQWPSWSFAPAIFVAIAAAIWGSTFFFIDSSPSPFIRDLNARSAGVRLNFVLGVNGDRKPADGLYWRIGTYVMSRAGRSATITGWFPRSCFDERVNHCIPPELTGDWKGIPADLDETQKVISVGDKILTYDTFGKLSDKYGNVGYISFDP